MLCYDIEKNIYICNATLDKLEKSNYFYENICALCVRYESLICLVLQPRTIGAFSITEIH